MMFVCWFGRGREQLAGGRRLPPILYIKPSRGWRALDLKEIWVYRELLYFFVWRDVKVRYKQASLGVAWAILQPVATMIVFATPRHSAIT